MNRSTNSIAARGLTHFSTLLRCVLVATTALCTGAAVAQAPRETVAPNPKLPQAEIRAGMHVIRAEVADEPATRQRGLMMREQLGANEGMLFVFTDKTRHCFWMRNTLIPLSIAFVDDDGTIANIEDMAPQTENSHCSVRPTRYALEMEQGWFAKKGIRAGARLTQPKFFETNAAK